MGVATSGIEEIEVVVLGGEEDDHVGRPLGRSGPAGRRVLQAALAGLVVLVVQFGPVVLEQPVERAAEPRSRPVEAGPCPPPEGRRLWCSFLDDPGCCPVASGGVVPEGLPPGSRAA